MDEIKLDVQIRDQIGSRKVKVLRSLEFFPAVVYGGDKGPTTIKVKKREYESIMRHHKGQNVVFHLNVMEGDKKLRDYSVIVKEEQNDPVTDDLYHVDFKRISLTEEIEVKVAIKANGEAIGVKQDGGSLDQVIWDLDVVCLPTNIPEKIEVVVDELNIGDAIHVRDVLLPAGVMTKHDPDAIVLSVVPPTKEEEEAPEGEEGEESIEPEVIKEKKPKEEGEAAEPEAQEEAKEE